MVIASSVNTPAPVQRRLADGSGIESRVKHDWEVSGFASLFRDESQSKEAASAQVARPTVARAPLPLAAAVPFSTLDVVADMVLQAPISAAPTPGGADFREWLPALQAAHRAKSEVGSTVISSASSADIRTDESPASGGKARSSMVDRLLIQKAMVPDALERTTVHLNGASVAVWMRRQGFGAGDVEALSFSLRTELAQLGLRLARLIINGRPVADTATPEPSASVATEAARDLPTSSEIYVYSRSKHVG